MGTDLKGHRQLSSDETKLLLSLCPDRVWYWPRHVGSPRFYRVDIHAPPDRGWILSKEYSHGAYIKLDEEDA